MPTSAVPPPLANVVKLTPVMINAYSTHSHFVNSGVTVLNLIKFLHNVEKLLPFRLNRRCDIPIHFGMPVCWMKVGYVNFAKLPHKWLPRQRPSSTKRSASSSSHIFTICWQIREDRFDTSWDMMGLPGGHGAYVERKQKHSTIHSPVGRHGEHAISK